MQLGGDQTLLLLPPGGDRPARLVEPGVRDEFVRSEPLGQRLHPVEDIRRRSVDRVEQEHLGLCLAGDDVVAHVDGDPLGAIQFLPALAQQRDRPEGIGSSDHQARVFLENLAEPFGGREDVDGMQRAERARGRGVEQRRRVRPEAAGQQQFQRDPRAPGADHARRRHAHPKRVGPSAGCEQLGNRARERQPRASVGPQGNARRYEAVERATAAELVDQCRRKLGNSGQEPGGRQVGRTEVIGALLDERRQNGVSLDELGEGITRIAARRRPLHQRLKHGEAPGRGVDRPSEEGIGDRDAR